MRELSGERKSVKKSLKKDLNSVYSQLCSEYSEYAVQLLYSQDVSSTVPDTSSRIHELR